VQVALVGDPRATDFRALARAVDEHYIPALVLGGGPPSASGEVALLANRPLLDGRATAYVCRQYVCDAPVTEPLELGEQLERGVTAASPPRSDPSA
jgi:uncharacterized protein YyaL (SSP411 family)